MQPPAFSVVISTFNRRTYLQDCVESLTAQRYPAEAFEIVIADNNSTDQTGALADEYARRSPVRIKYFNEPRQGISFARNRGVRESAHPIAAFIDDDATAEKDWLGRLAEIYRAHPDAGVVGGRIEAVWPGPKPAWVTPNLEKALGGKTDYGSDIRELHFPDTPYGGNFSVPRSLFLEIGGFSSALGRKKHSLLGCEEVLLCRHIAQQEKRVFFTPHAVVHHRVLPEKLTLRYLIKRAYSQGLSSAAVVRQCSDLQWPGRAQLARGLKNTVTDTARHLLTGRHGLWAEDLYTFCQLLARLKEALREG